MEHSGDLDRLAFNEAPIGLVLTEQRIIKACNKTFADMFGYSTDDLLNRSFRMLYETRAEFDAIRDIGLGPLRDSGKYTDERLMLHRNGTMFWCRFRAHTLTPDDPLGRTVLSFADISGNRPLIALTPRERQVITLLRKGHTSKEIARALSISPRTVEDYRARLLDKFGVRNIAELLAHIVGVP